ncbi:MAG: hypothetical protein KGL39_04145 [Patescibacteria group bacterium]|nr:hypothetical protein [Patescibacteria group bacterium]
MALTAYDAAFAPLNPPSTDIVCFYGPGGDPYHVWSTADIQRQSARYRLPIFVRDNPVPGEANSDAQTFLAWLESIGAPKGTATVLDLEEAVAPDYVYAYGQAMHAAGYLVFPYGSPAYLMQNPALDGYWLGDPGATAIPANCIGVQFGQGGNGAWDLSWFVDGLALWDTLVIPLPQTDPRGDNMVLHTISFETDANGNGFETTNIPWDTFLSVSIQGSDPAPDVDNAYWPGTAKVQNRGGNVLVSVVGFLPRQVATVFIAATA